MAELHLLDSCAAGGDGELHDRRRPRVWKVGALFLRELLVFLDLEVFRTQSSALNRFFFLVQSRVLIPMTLNISALYSKN